MQSTRYRTLAEFWPYYVCEHNKPATRWLHFVGNTNLFAWLLLALFKRDLRLVLVAVVSSYALAWVGHFGIERNRPATFQYPLMSALCDMAMYGHMWRGSMDAEVAKYTQTLSDQ